MSAPGRPRHEGSPVSTPAPAARRILIVEDDDKIAAIVADFLAASGYATERHAEGTGVAAAVRACPPAAIILDLNLPGADGIEVCKAIRQFSAVPIMMLTARIDEIDRLLGLELGADDYVCKPFSPREVVARIKALLRRSEPRTGDDCAGRDFVVDEAARRIRLRNRELPLTPLEYQLLRTLLAHPERVYTRDQLLDALHEDLRDISDRAVDSHIKNLRRKIEAVVPDANCIRSVYGVGYRFETL
jgi:two-component system response regulator BaeR